MRMDPYTKEKAIRNLFVLFILADQWFEQHRAPIIVPTQQGLISVISPFVPNRVFDKSAKVKRLTIEDWGGNCGSCVVWRHSTDTFFWNGYLVLKSHHSPCTNRMESESNVNRVSRALLECHYLYSYPLYRLSGIRPSKGPHNAQWYHPCLPQLTKINAATQNTRLLERETRPAPRDKTKLHPSLLSTVCINVIEFRVSVKWWASRRMEIFAGWLLDVELELSMTEWMSVHIPILMPLSPRIVIDWWTVGSSPTIKCWVNLSSSCGLPNAGPNLMQGRRPTLRLIPHDPNSLKSPSLPSLFSSP
jgi:hypothetical protein